MTFNFNAINTAEKQDITLWDHIRDQMRPNAPESHVHLAYCAEVIDRIDGYKSVSFLIRFWFQQTAGLRAVAEADPATFLDVIHHFEAAIERLTDIPARDRPTAAQADNNLTERETT